MCPFCSWLIAVDDVHDPQSLSPAMKEPITVSSANSWSFKYLLLYMQMVAVKVYVPSTVALNSPVFAL